MAEIVNSYELKNGRNLCLSDRNLSNEFEENFEAVKSEKPQTLQDFIILLSKK